MSNITEVLLQVALVFYILKMLLEGSLVIAGILTTVREVREREEGKKREMADLLLKEE